MKTSSAEKLRSDFVSEQPSKGFKHDRILASASADKISNAKHSPSIVYPPPLPNQWFVPVI
ncbi:hypothetical protein MTR_8g015700 [Medicago truncatula]|uniref:Uncharacterized protein n=1 Tax=Medicago truncatula TaxID=3880 RepID=G8A2T4_MEDTR|nr:hypothetical protein MTR_8g015700 [Medicago truncatula]